MLSEVQLDENDLDNGGEDRHLPLASAESSATIRHWPVNSRARTTAGNNRTAALSSPYSSGSHKRPRRKVVQRSIDSLPQTTDDEAGNETDNLLGFHIKQRSKGHQHHLDPQRAPKVALAFFLLVCSIGGYRGFNEYWSNRAIISSSAITNGAKLDSTSEGEEFDHRETLLSLQNPSDIEINAKQNTNNIEDIPVLLYNENIEVPWQLSGLANVFQEPYDPEKNKLYLWTIPRSGSTSIKRIASQCMGLTMASEAGKGDIIGDTLQVLEGDGMMKYANVDMSYPEGIARAKELGVGGWRKVDLVSSSYLYDGAGIFDPNHKGYMIAMFRHPIERAVSLFYSLKSNKAYAEQTATLQTIEQYSRSSLVENNWMTRFLSNSLSGELTPEHEAIAKEVLRTKCIIGLLQEKAESLRRLEMLFDVKAEKSKRRYDCQEKLWYWDWPGKNRHEQVLEGSEAWNRLYEQNSFDIRLYEYARYLFKAQGKLFQTSKEEQA